MSSKVAVLGMGYWGKNLVRNFHNLGVLHTVCDADTTREATVKEQYPGVAFTNDMRTVLDDRSINAVAVSTPAATHYDIVRTALEAGKDVFVEKPLALKESEGRELVELAEKQGRMLMVGHILQYHPAVTKLKEMVHSGELGRIQYIYSNRLSIGKIRTEENILWSFAPHDISVILSLLNHDPEYVSCHGKAHLTQDVADSTLSIFSFPNNVQAHIHVSWLHPFKEQRLVVIGSEKMAVFEDTSADKLVVYPHKVKWENQMPTAVKAEREVIEIPPAEPLKNECQAFLDAVESRKPPISDGHEGLDVLRMLNYCQTSLENNGQNIRVSGDQTPKEDKPYFVHPTAFVDEPSDIGEGTKIWHFCHVMKNATIGKKCVFGQNCNVDSGVKVGNNVKVQNNVSLYTGLEIEDDVFLGPSCVLTNVTNPRSQVLRHSLYEKTLLRRGCSIGANATIVCGIEIGRYAFVGAGAVVTATVPDYAMMLGVPAKQKGWVSRHGLPLRNPVDGIYTCPESGLRYQEEDGKLHCLDLDEEAPLPEDMREGSEFYDDIVHGERLT
ncbi:UDP-2-acetamido-3-amino-2, 3-dideoxy-D-glucuronate N-acetyltransferase [bacterium BMS3Bbin04]|nr:UDP-2-acetamido-3-amino-2, 3-dideoxy-D-glucuronate N-acetyltransferase [bacterium BMS3Bbin04]